MCRTAGRADLRPGVADRDAEVLGDAFRKLRRDIPLGGRVDVAGVRHATVGSDSSSATQGSSMASVAGKKRGADEAMREGWRAATARRREAQARTRASTSDDGTSLISMGREQSVRPPLRRAARLHAPYGGARERWDLVCGRAGDDGDRRKLNNRGRRQRYGNANSQAAAAAPPSSSGSRYSKRNKSCCRNVLSLVSSPEGAPPDRQRRGK